MEKRTQMNPSAKNAITKVRDTYGEVFFRMGLHYLITTGYDKVSEITEQDVIDYVKQKEAEEAAKEQRGTLSLITPQAEADIIRCGMDLVKFSVHELLKYVQNEMFME